MSNEALPQSEDELSDEQLTHVSGGDGNSVQPSSTPNLTNANSNNTQMAIEKVEIAIEKVERVLR